MGHQNTKKHKAKHGGYRDKPSKKQIDANLNFWVGGNSKQKEAIEVCADSLETPVWDLFLKTGGYEKGELTVFIGTPRLEFPSGTQLKLNL